MDSSHIYLGQDIKMMGKLLRGESCNDQRRTEQEIQDSKCQFCG